MSTLTGLISDHSASMLFIFFLGFLIGSLTNITVKALGLLSVIAGCNRKKKEEATPSESAIMADWSQLPDDLLKLIARQLHSIEDYVRFGAVCRSWHWIFLQKDCSSYPKLPWMVLRREENSDICGFYSPFSDKVYNIHLPEIRGRRCWGSGHGWLVTIGSSRDVNILNPFSRVQIPLPPLDSCPNLNNLICTPKVFRDVFVYKAILSSDPSSSDCVVVAIYSDCEKLAFTKPGNESWTPLECSLGPFDDIIYFNGNFFVVNCTREVLIFNSTGSHIKTVDTDPTLPPVDDLAYEDKYPCRVWRGYLYGHTMSL
ncbi:hypothetical protein L1049_018270 [Liquidambar formosana]|uniref:F-box domain-containing protein n=1 Tax=Liquidambar formosana TaxID=63359 RepID=A0AAP0WMM5_LIQFO